MRLAQFVIVFYQRDDEREARKRRIPFTPIHAERFRVGNAKLHSGKLTLRQIAALTCKHWQSSELVFEIPV